MNPNVTYFRYPVVLVENKARKYAIFDVVRAKSGFLTFGRLPARQKYVDGQVFDSSGRIFTYLRSAGWPRFGEVAKSIGEALIVPGLIATILSRVVYFGPHLTSQRSVTVDDFRQELLKNLARHVSAADRLALEGLLGKQDGFEEIVEAVNWWRFHGGARRGWTPAWAGRLI